VSDFSVKLSDCRRRIPLSQSELARQAGVSASLINRLESGDREPGSRELVLGLARAMDLGKDDTDALLVSAGFAPEYPIEFAHPIQRLLDDFLNDEDTDEYDVEVVETLIRKLMGRRSEGDPERQYRARPIQRVLNVDRKP